jgi:hypothetical protein
MEKGMDRKLRVAPTVSTGWGPWLRALGLAAAVAGAGLAVGTTAPSAALAQSASGKSMSVPLAPDAPDTYVVKKGDTLWDIAGVFLKYPWYWPEIWYVNPQVQNPHLIYPGDVLRLVYVDGKPRVTVETAGEVRLSPQVRTEPLSESVRAIPYGLLMNFVQRPGVLDKKQIKNLPYVVGFRDRHIVGSRQNEFYAQGLGNPPAGTRYTVMHVGDPVHDPDDGDLLGYIAHFGGVAQVIMTSGDKGGDGGITHLTVVDSGSREILPGDKLLPGEPPKMGDDFVMSAPKDTKLNGQVVAIVDGLYVAGRYQVLAINRGKKDGLAPGNIVAIYARGEEIRDRYSRGGLDWQSFTASYDTVKLPNERSGTMMLFEVHSRMSYGLVVESTQAMRIGDFIKHPDFGHSDTGLSNYMR